MDVAFSRDGSEKIYVQHRMKEQSRDIFAWLEEGAHVYVCGDAANMAPDVHSALIDIVASEARTRSEEHTSELQSLMRHSYAVFCLQKKTNRPQHLQPNTV